jgi:hypothetical protein
MSCGLLFVFDLLVHVVSYHVTFCGYYPVYLSVTRVTCSPTHTVDELITYIHYDKLSTYSTLPTYTTPTPTYVLRTTYFAPRLHYSLPWDAETGTDAQGH